MDPRNPALALGLSYRMHEHEAGLLVDSLRSSRVTLLYAAAGASRGALLRDCVVPLLARRESDASADQFLESRVVAPFIDRRQAANDSAHVEHAVLFSKWEGDPLAALHAVLQSRFPDDRDPVAHRRLVDTLASICERRGGRLLIVLDAVEELWTAHADASATSGFIGAFKEAVNDPSLPVNFLLAADGRCESRLDALRRDIPRFDDSTVRLLGFDDGAAPVVRQHPAPAPEQRAAPRPAHAGLPTLSDAVSAPLADRPASAPTRSRRQKPPKVPLPPSVPIKTDGVYAFIESTLAATADASEPWHEAGADSAAAVPASRSDGFRQPPLAGPGRQGPPGPALGPQPAPPAEPSSPIDEWLDSAIAWCRRMLRAR